MSERKENNLKRKRKDTKFVPGAVPINILTFEKDLKKFGHNGLGIEVGRKSRNNGS